MQNLVFSPIDPEILIARISEEVSAKVLNAIKKPFSAQTQKDSTYGINEVSERTGYSVATIYAKVHKRQIPFHKSPNGSKLMFFENEIADWLDGNVPLSPEERADGKMKTFDERRDRK